MRYTTPVPPRQNAVVASQRTATAQGPGQASGGANTISRQIAHGGAQMGHGSTRTVVLKRRRKSALEVALRLSAPNMLGRVWSEANLASAPSGSRRPSRRH